MARSYLNYRQDLCIAALLNEMKTAGEMEALAEFATEYRDQLPSGHELDIVRTFQMSWDIAPTPAKQMLRGSANWPPRRPSLHRPQAVESGRGAEDLRQLEEARDLMRKALASAEQSFAPGHPSIAHSQSNLAVVLQDLGQLEETWDLLRKAYSASLERYGPDYRATRAYKRTLDILPTS